MAVSIFVRDETLPGSRAEATRLQVANDRTTLRELLRERIQREVEEYNAQPTETFSGLVQPEESERMLNGFRMRTRQKLDWERQFERACSSFEQKGFLVFVGNVQVMGLDQALTLQAETEVQFVKLVPLVGG